MSEKEWIKIEEDPSPLYREKVERTFSPQRMVIYLTDLIIGYLLYIVVYSPLLTLARFLRTFEWAYILDFPPYLVFLLLIACILTPLYYLSHTLRHSIRERVFQSKTYFLTTILGYVFGVLIVNLLINPLMALSYLIVYDTFPLNLELLIDEIISALLVFGIFALSYMRSRRKYRS